MQHTGKAIQGVVLLSTVLGVVFLWQASGLVPTEVFYIVGVGWFLFLIDSALTFVRPRISYYLAFVLALLTLAPSLTQPAHFAFIGEGLYVPAAIFIAGSLAQVVLLILVPLHFIRPKKGTADASTR